MRRFKWARRLWWRLRRWMIGKLGLRLPTLGRLSGVLIVEGDAGRMQLATLGEAFATVGSLCQLRVCGERTARILFLRLDSATAHLLSIESIKLGGQELLAEPGEPGVSGEIFSEVSTMPSLDWPLWEAGTPFEITARVLGATWP